MIDLHYWPTPNGHKITMFLEEAGLAYRIVPVNITAGDLIETGGDWYPVIKVDDDVHVRVTLDEHSWTSRIPRDTITGHRPS